MTTLLVSQPNGSKHQTPDGHAERAERLDAVAHALSSTAFDNLLRREAPAGDLQLSSLAHSDDVLKRLQRMRPADGIRQLDPDTFISSGSLDASSHALGGALSALDAVIGGEADNAFCAIRPPGHHAERDKSMGFCLVNTIAIAARHAQQAHGIERVAILDFDVHHGNGTQDVFYDDPNVLFVSSHQMPLYPWSGEVSETGVGNVFNVPLSEGSDGDQLREAYDDVVWTALNNFSPDLLLISAGFDAHIRDPLAGLNWRGTDYSWITGHAMEIADKHCDGRVISLLEGGYDLTGLSEGVSNHVHMLLHGTAPKL